MKAIVEKGNKKYQVDFSQPIDISISITGKEDNVCAWYLEAPTIVPVEMGDFVGSVASRKSSTNFRTISFNPHAHGTHTECLGHITQEVFSVNQYLKNSFFWAELITLEPQKQGEDWVLTKEQLEQKLHEKEVQALIIRTIPNEIQKKNINYSHTNPPYMTAEAMEFVVSRGIEHLLIDLPSVDKEKDEGALTAHKIFWQLTDVQEVNAQARHHATITEFIYVPNAVPDGLYVLNLQTAPFENDATPSRPVLFEVALI